MNSREEAQKKIREMSIDNLLKTCIFELNREITTRKETPGLFYEFREHLAEAMSSVPRPPESETPIPQLSFMVEDFAKGISRLIVSMASVGPYLLRRAGGLPEDQVNLIRRGLEEHLTGLVEQMLRRLVLEDHLEFTDLSSTAKRD